MSMKKKLGIAVGALLISGGILTGAALANEAPATTDPAAQTQGVAKANPLSEAAKEILTKLGEIRKSYMEKANTDAKALVDQAVAAGKITQDEADKLLHHGGKGFRPGMEHRGGFKGAPMGRGGEKGGFFKGDVRGNLQSKLDEAVKAGTITQEQATKLLEQLKPKAEANK